MSYLELELDVHKYDFDDMLRMYKLNNDMFFIKFRESLPKMQEILLQVKTHLENCYIVFYSKIFKILQVTHDLYCEDFSIKDQCNTVVNLIKSIDNFDLKENDLIIETVKKSLYTSKPVIVQDKTNRVVSTVNNSVSPGVLNSIKRVTQKSNFYLNSMFRKNYVTTTSTNFYYDLPVEVKNVVALSLASIELPNSWYTVSSKNYNNKFKIITKNCSIVKEWDIILEDGNYNSNTFQSYLNTTYFFLSSTYADTELSNIKYSVDDITGKSIFESVVPSSTFSFDILFIFCGDKDYVCPTKKNILPVGWLLGFRNLKYLNINKMLVSEALVDCGDRYIYFSLNDFQYNNNANNVICFKDSTADNNILAKIPVSFDKCSVVFDSTCCSLTKARIYNGPVTIKRIQVILYDKYGNIIDLNEMDFSYTLEFEILYEGFNFDNISY